MVYQLPPLPYAVDALAPHISRMTLEYHYGKHHKGYVDKLNKLLETESEEHRPLVELFTSTDNKNIFNNAAQVWNHSFYWNCLSPHGGGEPPKAFVDVIKESSFGDFEGFKAKFTESCENHFGSGWGWLVRNQDGSLEVVDTHDADNPLTRDKTPILTCDVWEHAYYIDYQNERKKYVEAFWNVVNWEFVQKNLESPEKVARFQE